MATDPQIAADCSVATMRDRARLYAAAEALGRASDAVDRLTEEDISGYEWAVLDAVSTVGELADLLLTLGESEEADRG